MHYKNPKRTVHTPYMQLISIVFILTLFLTLNYLLVIICLFPLLLLNFIILNEYEKKHHLHVNLNLNNKPFNSSLYKAMKTTLAHFRYVPCLLKSRTILQEQTRWLVIYMLMVW